MKRERGQRARKRAESERERGESEGERRERERGERARERGESERESEKAPLALRATRPHTVGYMGVCDQEEGAFDVLVDRRCGFWGVRS
jgi:hypothetical protein